MARPTVAVIGTGGTISSLGHHSLELATYVDHATVMEVGDLIAKVPELDRVADVVPVPFRAIPSTAMGPAVWPELLAIVHETAARPDVDGIAVTHGTATLEETAYFLNLTVETDKTVVLVGAQRPASGLSTDAFLNLLNAVRVAGAPEARGMGVLTVLNDEIHAAREVTKTHSARAQTFKAPDFGVLGHADEDRVAIYRRPVRVHAPEAARELGLPDRLPRVEIAYSYGGSDGAVLRAMADLGAEGIVMAALAPGNPTPEEHEVMEEVMARGVVFVMGTRAGAGRLVPLERRRPKGTVLADNLTVQKARILLMLGLARTKDPEELQALFHRF